jgi:SAM-dependent methyltransferase
MNVEKIYRNRFADQDKRDKDAVWKVLCNDFFARYIPQDATVIDLGAGYCEFINHIVAARRIAIDANPDLRLHASPGVEARVENVASLTQFAGGMADVIFSSNFFEHLPDKATLNQTVVQIHRILKPGGHAIIMGPNVRYLAGEYWDYYDHHIPLSEKSLAELLHSNGFTVDVSLARFMPYTVKSRLPKWPWLIQAYLRLGKPAFALFGKQFLVVASKPHAS